MLNKLAKFSLVSMLSIALVACGGNEKQTVEVEKENQVETTTNVSTQQTTEKKTSIEDIRKEYGTDIMYDIQNIEDSFAQMTEDELEYYAMLVDSFQNYGGVLFDYTTKTYFLMVQDETTINAFNMAIEQDDQDMNEIMYNLVQTYSETSVYMSIDMKEDYSIVFLNPHNVEKALIAISNGVVLYNEFEK